MNLSDIEVYENVRVFQASENEPKTLKDLSKKMRNSFAHQNICFKKYNNQIVGVYLWGYANMKTGKNNEPDWVVYLKGLWSLLCLVLDFPASIVILLE